MVTEKGVIGICDSFSATTKMQFRAQNFPFVASFTVISSPKEMAEK